MNTSSSVSSTVSTTATRSCAGADPTFKIQFIDSDPSNSDQYNGNYLKATFHETYYVWNVTDSASSATSVVYECSTGNLRLLSQAVYYADADYFVALAPVYFDTPEMIALNEYQYFNCTVSGGYLACSVPYPRFRPVMQTCPEYADPVAAYDTPVALGDMVYTAPKCYGKLMKMIF